MTWVCVRQRPPKDATDSACPSLCCPDTNEPLALATLDPRVREDDAVAEEVLDCESHSLSARRRESMRHLCEEPAPHGFPIGVGNDVVGEWIR